MHHAPSNQLSEALIASEFVWNEIEVGDLIMLEADFYDGGGLKLNAQRGYQVLTKSNNNGLISLLVESDLTGDLIPVHPALVCSYQTCLVPIARA
ncbi:MAG: hypothetical protein ACPGPF_10505 [Pontibacterium sp.]